MQPIQQPNRPKIAINLFMMQIMLPCIRKKQIPRMIKHHIENRPKKENQIREHMRSSQRQRHIQRSPTVDLALNGMDIRSNKPYRRLELVMDAVECLQNHGRCTRWM